MSMWPMSAGRCRVAPAATTTRQPICQERCSSISMSICRIPRAIGVGILCRQCPPLWPRLTGWALVADRLFVMTTPVGPLPPVCGGCCQYSDSRPPCSMAGSGIGMARSDRDPLRLARPQATRHRSNHRLRVTIGPLALLSRSTRSLIELLKVTYFSTLEAPNGSRASPTLLTVVPDTSRAACRGRGRPMLDPMAFFSLRISCDHNWPTSVSTSRLLGGLRAVDQGSRDATICWRPRSQAYLLAGSTSVRGRNGASTPTVLSPALDPCPGRRE